MLKYLICPPAQKRFRTVGITLFAAWVGLVIIRILVRYINIESDLAFDAVFTIPVQLGLLLALPFFMYKLVLKMNTRQVLEFSNVRKVRPVYLLLCVPLGVCVFVATIGISTVWQSLLIMLGYTHTSSSADLPEKFNFFMFLASLILTAGLPAVCEEFAVRGGLLTTVKNSFRPEVVILLMGVAFGLFHQNITQVFYTALFGAFMAFLALKFKSILPCMIVHFMNNGLSVYLDYASAYGWWGGGFFDSINAVANRNPLALVAGFAVVVGVGAGITVLMVYLLSKEKLEKKKELIQDAGFDHTHNRVVLMGGENKKLVEDVGMVKEVYGDAYVPDEKYKPTARDGAFYIGAIVLSALTTIFSFIWGLFY